MAAMVDKAKLIDCLVESWSQSTREDSGFSVRVDEVRRNIGRLTVEPVELVLDEASLVPRLFGYREAAWARLRPGCVVPQQSALEALITNRPWIPQRWVVSRSGSAFSTQPKVQ